MRVISFCADGIKQAAAEGLYEWFEQQDADIFCVQDLRCEERDLPDRPYFPEGYNAYFLDSPEGVNGVAIYTRQLPKAIMTGLGLGQADIEARYIQADFAELSVCSLMPPPVAAEGSIEQANRQAFLHQLQIRLDRVRKKRRQYILCGNWGFAHQAKDLDYSVTDAGPEEERERLDAIFDLGYLDAFRAVSRDEDEFSWWPNGRDSGGARRVDYQIVSASLENRIEYGAYFKNQVFSSHAPLVMDYDHELQGL